MILCEVPFRASCRSHYWRAPLLLPAYSPFSEQGELLLHRHAFEESISIRCRSPLAPHIRVKWLAGHGCSLLVLLESWGKQNALSRRCILEALGITELSRAEPIAFISIVRGFSFRILSSSLNQVWLILFHLSLSSELCRVGPCWDWFVCAGEVQDWVWGPPAWGPSWGGLESYWKWKVPHFPPFLSAHFLYFCMMWCGLGIHFCRRPQECLTHRTRPLGHPICGGG